jgi:hypothetical protein
MLLDGSNWQLVFLGSERFANWRSYVLPYCAEPCPRALMEFDGEGRKQGRERTPHGAVLRFLDRSDPRRDCSPPLTKGNDPLSAKASQ